jgi:methylenetetrahydrofolate reductase (NADPH)
MNGAPTFSVEFFPPKDELGEARLWDSLDKLIEFRPDYVSVTYGAGGSTRDRTIRVTSEITARTGLKTVAHLTCVGSTEVELQDTLHRYQEAGIDSILALRGDPPGGPKFPWISTPGGFDHSDELVSLAKELGFQVGVAAYPDKHPASKDFEEDIQVLLEKERRGATSATTQFFFEVDRYFDLRDRLESAGSKMRLIPGILPISNLKQLERMAELGGTEIPKSIRERALEIGDDLEGLRQFGIEVASQIAERLIQGHVSGLHFYTMNSARATIAVLQNLGLR